MHLLEADGVRVLNAEDFYADVVTAATAVNRRPRLTINRRATLIRG
jgi:hypothetical protein